MASRTFTELPSAAILVQATVLGTGVLLTTACANKFQTAPTCGPCCHGDPSACHPQEVEQPPIEEQVEEQEPEQAEPEQAEPEQAEPGPPSI